MDKALHRTLYLNSGATLVIDPTEALTVIDVNTGKAIKGGKNMQATFLKVNLEAAEEIAPRISAEVVCVVGTKIVFYRQSEKKQKIFLP